MKRVVISIASLLLCLSAVSLSACDNSKKAEADEPAAEKNEKKEQKGAQKKEKEAPEQADEEKAEGGEDGAKKGAQKLPENLEQGEAGTYGADFTIDGEPITLAKALEKGADSPGPYKVSAHVEKVCKKKGCWFTLNSEEVEEPIRVRMTDYGFFVPRNSDGGDAVVEGEIEKRKLTEKELEHFAKDEGKDPSEVDTSEREVFEFTATAVKISMK